MAKDNRALLLWGIGALLLVGGGVAVYTGTRGLRNNNPGNIKYDGTQWEGLANPPTDGTFCIFVSAEYGIRAIAHILTNYQNLDGLNTVDGMISRWSETDQASYINNVSQALGVNPDDPIQVSDPATMQNMIAAIVTQENGFNPYDAGTIQNSIALA